MKKDSLLIISNNSNKAEIIRNKIRLLRKTDKIKTVSYLESISILNTYIPKIILLYISKEDSIQIIKEIKTIKALEKVPLIIVTDEINEEILFNGYDFGMDDFITLKDPDSIIIMRILLSLKKSMINKKNQDYEMILKSANIIEKNSNIYTNKYADTVLKYFFKNSKENDNEDMVLMNIKLIPKNKENFNINKIGQLIQTIPRKDDIITYNDENGFYIILYNSNRNGAKAFANRITKTLKEYAYVYINASEATSSFEELKNILRVKIKEQIESNIDFNYFFEADINDYIAESTQDNTAKESTKFEKEERYNQLRNIILPVFYHFQTIYMNMYPDIKIKFDTDNELSIFIIEKEKISSKITIRYPNFCKIIIEKTNINNEFKPETQKISYKFEEFNEDILSDILKELFNEFAQRISHNEVVKPE